MYTHVLNFAVLSKHTQTQISTDGHMTSQDLSKINNYQDTPPKSDSDDDTYFNKKGVNAKINHQIQRVQPITEHVTHPICSTSLVTSQHPYKPQSHKI
jgi:hypothetical protein